MMTAATAGYRGRRVLLLDHAPKAGAKVRIAGGGKCNFTNRQVSAANFHGQNPHFVKSALARYRPEAFIELVERHGIDYEERDHGQLFCRGSAGELVAMLRTECDWAGVQLQLNCRIGSVTWQEGQYQVQTSQGLFSAPRLVVATGALSYPKLKASDLGYRLARQFGLKVIEPRPGLVGLTLDMTGWPELAGISLPVGARCQGHHWVRDLLFTHGGISGPAVLQISNLWQPGLPIELDLLPHTDTRAAVLQLKRDNRELRPWLRSLLVKRLADAWLDWFPLAGRPADLPDDALTHWADQLHHWQLWPTGTDGYAKAEVTVGGVDTSEVSSKTLEALHQPGLYFVGEVLDVTGDLGGFNLQWAWASGTACGLAV